MTKPKPGRPDQEVTNRHVRASIKRDEKLADQIRDMKKAFREMTRRVKALEADGARARKLNDIQWERAHGVRNN